MSPRTPTLPPTEPAMRKKIRNTGEVHEMARSYFGPVEDPVTPSAPLGRDPLAQRAGEKVKFFKGDWREAWPEDFTAHRPDGAA